MKIKLTTILAGLLIASAAFAQSPQGSYTISADIPYVSKYVFRGVELAKESLQPSITYVAGSLTAGIWTSQPIVDNTDNEFDFLVGYDFQLSKDWKLNVGGTVYYYPELDTRTGGDRTTYEPKLSLVGPLGPVSSVVTVYYDATLKNTTLEGSLGYSAPIQGRDNDTVDFGAAYGHVSTDLGSDYSYWSASAKATFRPKANLSVYFGVVYASNDLSGAKRDHFYGIAGVSLSL
jgi:uncharacterized protein (TIGR02001 family)